MRRLSEKIARSSRLRTVAALFLVVTACAPLRPETPGVPVGSEIGQALVEGWRGRHASVVSLQGIARVKVSSPERSGGGTQVVLAEKPDHLRAETLSPFGTPILTVVSDGRELGVLVPATNRFYRGTATTGNIARFTRVPLKPADLVRVLLYQAPLIDDLPPATFQLADGGWLAVYEAGSKRQELVFDRQHRLVEVRYLQGGGLFLALSYDQFGDDGFPHAFVLRLPEFDTVASLDFSELATNRDFLPGIFKLAPPAGATVYDLDERVTPEGESR